MDCATRPQFKAIIYLAKPIFEMCNFHSNSLKVKVKVKISLSLVDSFDPMDCIAPGIVQARILWPG